MKVGWRIMPFLDVVDDESGGNLKTPQTEFLREGRFAVVDQGKELIAGYVNDETRLCHSKLPVIVFGDHTRCFKFVDFQFCMGADGVKVLRPKLEADVKYLYHYLRQVKLTEGGYDRHFKYLKRSEIVLPPLPEQRRIAEVLDRAEALRAKRRAALAQLDTLTQAIFLDIFKSNVHTQIYKLCEVADLKRGPFGGSLKKEIFVDQGFKVYEQRNVIQNNFLIGKYFITEMKYREMEDFALRPMDLIVSCSGTLGKVSIFPPNSPHGIINQALLRIRVKSDKITPIYLKNVLESIEIQSKLTGISHGTGLQNFPPMSEVRSLRIVVPPLLTQYEFAHRVAAVEKLKTAHRASLAELDALFAALQHRAFRGEL